MKNQTIYAILLLLAFFSCKTDLKLETKNSNFKTNSNAKSAITTYQLLEIGGSNYPMYDVQDYINNPTEQTWYTDGALNLAIGHYHLNPNKVNSQLSDMYNRGQRKIALPIWFASLSNVSGDTYGHLVRSSGGKMTTQHLDNFKAVLNKISEIGYKEVIIRFGPQSANRPTEWTNWDENKFQENWNFQNKAIKEANTILNEKGIKHQYDLCIELGGIVKGQAEPYAKKLWQNYLTVFGNTQSYGYSIAHAPGRITNLINNLKTTNELPAEFAFDIYNNIDKALNKITEELTNANQITRPIIIQECHYNNNSVFDTIMTNVTRNNLRLRFIMQWPVIKDDDVKHFGVNYCQLYYSYARPYIYNAGSTCTDKNCIWITGQNFEADKAKVEIYKVSDNSLISTYSTADLTQEILDGAARIQLKLKTANEKSLFASSGLKVRVISPSYNNLASSLKLVRK